MSKEEDNALRVDALARQIEVILKTSAEDRAKLMLDLESKEQPAEPPISIESIVLAHDLGIQKIYESLNEMCGVIISSDFGSLESKLALTSKIASVKFWLSMSSHFKKQAIVKDKKRKTSGIAEHMRAAKQQKSDIKQETIKRHLDAYRAEHNTKAGAPAIAKEIVESINADLHEKGIDPLKWPAVRDRIYKADEIVGA